MGYSCMDIITTLFRVVRNNGAMVEWHKLEFIKVRHPSGLGALLPLIRNMLLPQVTARGSILS